MLERIDSASRLISANPRAVYRAFAEPGALEQWLPPKGMSAEILHFDFRSDGAYRARLTYSNPGSGQGKTSADSDLVDVRIVKLEADREIQQEVTFRSEDPAFAGVMRMTWTFEPENGGTRVTVRAANVPEGIRPEDHRAGLMSSLENLAAFLGDPSP